MRAFKCAVGLASTAVLASSAAASNGPLIAAGMPSPEVTNEIRLFEVDPGTGAATPWATIFGDSGQTELSNMTYVPAARELWLLTDTGTPNDNKDERLVRINIDTKLVVGSVALSGDVGSQNDVQGLEYIPSLDAVMVGWAPNEAGPEQFLDYRIGLVNSAGVVSGSTGNIISSPQDIDQIGWDPSSSTIFLGDFNKFGDDGFRLATLTDPFGANTITPVAPALERGENVESIAIGMDGTIYALRTEFGDLANSSLVTVGGGTYTGIGTLGHADIGQWYSLAFIPEPGTLALVSLALLAIRRR